MFQDTLYLNYQIIRLEITIQYIALQNFPNQYGHSTYAIDFISCIVETENESLSTKLFCNEIG